VVRADDDEATAGAQDAEQLVHRGLGISEVHKYSLRIRSVDRSIVERQRRDAAHPVFDSVHTRCTLSGACNHLGAEINANRTAARCHPFRHHPHHFTHPASSIEHVNPWGEDKVLQPDVAITPAAAGHTVEVRSMLLGLTARVDVAEASVAQVRRRHLLSRWDVTILCRHADAFFRSAYCSWENQKNLWSRS
jgi:hypothetical protein